MTKLDEAIAELKRLSNGNVTKIPLPDDGLLDEYERQIGFKFSDDYRKFLKEAGNIFYGSKVPLTVTKGGKGWGELKVALNDGRMIGLPHDWLPICEDNSNYFCIVSGGEIRYWSADGKNR